MHIEIVTTYSEDLVQRHPDRLFVFGENQAQKNTKAKGGGQALIRPFDNSFGFCTLEAIGQPWTDEHLGSNVTQIMADCLALKRRASSYNSVAFPRYGLGTGRAGMQKNAPKTFLFLCQQLLNEFGYNNLAYLEPPRF
jgi:hypothetical protein